ncbi:MAG: hypothetical protein RJQ21_14090 [Rhodospirillales bacterium]
MPDRQEFLNIVNDAVIRFPDNRMCQRVIAGEMSLPDYHNLLLTLFHQVYEAPTSMALAAATCDPEQEVAKEYLLMQADQAKEQWKLIKTDLDATGFAGPDPHNQFPSPPCQAYVAFNFYIAVKAPMARIATGLVLKTIGASFGGNYASKLVQDLDLTPDKASFLFAMSGDDTDHVDEVERVIEQAFLTERDWRWMCHAAKTASHLYANMYNAVITGTGRRHGD